MGRSKTRMVIACLVGCILGCSGLPKNGMTLAQAYTKVQKAVPVGSTKEKVEKWAESKGYRSTYISNLEKDKDVVALDLDKKQVYTVLEVTIDDTDRSLRGSSDIRILFVLNDEGKVTQQKVKLESYRN